MARLPNKQLTGPARNIAETRHGCSKDRVSFGDAFGGALFGHNHFEPINAHHHLPNVDALANGAVADRFRGDLGRAA